MPIVSDASPLIWLSKIGKIELLRTLFGEVIIPSEVYKEAVERGLQEGSSDALVIKECVDQGWTKISMLDPKATELCQKIMEHSSELHLGEAQAIIIARKNNSLLLMDESSGRAFAQAWGLKVKGVLFVIIKALKEDLLNVTEAKETTLDLVRKGFRIDPKLLARTISEIESFTFRKKISPT